MALILLDTTDGGPLTGYARLAPGVTVVFDAQPYCGVTGALRGPRGEVAPFCSHSVLVDAHTNLRVLTSSLAARLALAPPGARVAVFYAQLS